MNLNVEVGETASFSKTLTEAYHARHRRPRPDVSAAESKISRRIVLRGGGKAVSLGYDRIRFLKPVFVDDTLTATYTVAEVQPNDARAVGRCEIFNQAGDLVLVGQHVFKWVS